MGKVSKSLLVLGVLASVSAPVQPLLAATNASSENENSAAENSESTTKTVSGSSVELSSSSSSISTSSSSSNANISSSNNSSTSSSTKVESSSTSGLTTSSTEDAKQPSTRTTDEVKDEDALKANSLFGPGYYPEDFQKKISFRSGRNPFIRNTTSFLGGIKNGLQSGWNKHGVLPSVSAAQAILESGWGQSRLAIDGKNLFGIKGDYNGDYVVMPTQEYVNGCWITINAAFRKYPTWNESVEDHGYFLAVNPRYNNLIGETDYRKVTKYLQQDGYATAPNYSAYLNQLIQTYNLTSYDTHRYSVITSKTNVNYEATIAQAGRKDGLFTSGPYNTSATTQHQNASAKSYDNQGVRVSAEAKTSTGTTWVKIKLSNGQEYWLDKRGIANIHSYNSISGYKTVSYEATISQAGRKDGLFASGPYNTSAATQHQSASAKSFDNQKVTALAEEKTSTGVTWVRVRLNNGQVYWLDKRGIKNIHSYNRISGYKAVNYEAVISQNGRKDGLFINGPYNTSSTTQHQNAAAKSFNNQKITVSAEEKTSTGVTWIRVKLNNGQQYWLDKRGVRDIHVYNVISDYKVVNYTATISQNGRKDGLFINGPYNTSSTTQHQNAAAKSFNNQKITVSAEEKTSTGVTWAKIKLANGKQYWLDKRGIR